LVCDWIAVVPGLCLCSLGGVVVVVVKTDVESSMKFWSEVSLEEKLDSAQLSHAGTSPSGIEVNVEEPALSRLFTGKIGEKPE
jgi:hypothetical protein